MMRRLVLAFVATGLIAAVSLGVALAKPPGAQVFDVYDSTEDGLQVGTDSDIGNVQVVANPGWRMRT